MPVSDNASGSSDSLGGVADGEEKIKLKKASPSPCGRGVPDPSSAVVKVLLRRGKGGVRLSTEVRGCAQRKDESCHDWYPAAPRRGCALQ
jgi:hypothetical protein